MLAPDFKGIGRSFSPFNLMLAVGLLYIAFIMLRYVPVIPDFSKTFIMKGCWILSKAFLASSEIIMWVFFSQSVYMVDYIDGFSYVEPSLHHLIMVDYFSDMILYSIC